nr:unnamed protein product [Callosobruchus analis]
MKQPNHPQLGIIILQFLQRTKKNLCANTF